VFEHLQSKGVAAPSPVGLQVMVHGTVPLGELGGCQTQQAAMISNSSTSTSKQGCLGFQVQILPFPCWDVRASRTWRVQQQSCSAACMCQPPHVTPPAPSSLCHTDNSRPCCCTAMLRSLPCCRQRPVQLSCHRVLLVAGHCCCAGGGRQPHQG
jgi:hypothetical protein